MSWSYAFGELILPAVKLCALVFSLAGIALGIGLVARSGPTLHVMHALNRWVSSRRAIKALEVPRAAASGNRYVVGALLAAVGLYAIAVLARPEVAPKLAAVLGFDPRYSLPAIAIDAARWILVAGSGLVAVVGLLMLLAPYALSALEARTNRWISSRRIAAGADTMYLPLDRLAESSPRAAGVVIGVLSVAAAVASVVLLLPRP